MGVGAAVARSAGSHRLRRRFLNPRPGSAPTVPTAPAPPPNRAPTATAPIPPPTVSATGGPVTVDLSASFADPDGDSLTYTAMSDNTAVIEASVLNATLTLTPRGAGSATVTVTATDSGGLSVQQTIPVGVLPPGPEQPVPDFANGAVDLGGDGVPGGGAFRILVDAAERAQLPHTRNFEAVCRDFDIYDQAAQLSEAAGDAVIASITGGSREIAIMAADALMAFVSTHVATGECGLFFHGAPIHWDETTERQTVWTAILVSGSPEIGRPLRPAERSEWWLDISVTTFSGFRSGSAAMDCAGRGSAGRACRNLHRPEMPPRDRTRRA